MSVARRRAVVSTVRQFIKEPELKKMYLAGPDVFAREPQAIGARKKEICLRFGLLGIFPMDLVALDKSLPKIEQGLYIYDIMERTMRECDGIIVNMTPLHGPSMDVGSAFEMGFMKALDKPLFAYSNSDTIFAERVVRFWNGKVTTRPDGMREGGDQMALEEFDMVDNLMLDGSVRRSTNVFTLSEISADERYVSLMNFEACVAEAARWFSAQG